MFPLPKRFWRPRFSMSTVTIALCTSVACFTIQSAPAAQSPTLLESLNPTQKVKAAGPRHLTSAQNVVPGIPKRLQIASAGIDAPVKEVGLLPDGKLDVPADGQMLGWYKLGPRPGRHGNAVIDGHLETKAGSGAFWKLKEVKAGDMIDTIDDTGIRRTFRVRKTEIYDVGNAPMLEIFGDDDARHLNLITCAGTWSEKLNHYDKRLIVYSDLIEEHTYGL